MDDADFDVTPLEQRASEDPDRPPRAFLHRLTRWQRLRRAALIIGLLLVALTPLLVVSPDTSRAVATWLRISTPPRLTPALPGAATFLLANTVPWGDLAIDGHSAASLGIVLQWPYANAQVPTFTLPPGRHDLVYQADPFSPLRCQVSVPATPADTCPLLSPAQAPIFPPPGGRILDARALPSSLPPNAFAALAEAVQDRLAEWSGATQLAPGDHYLGANGQLTIAPFSAQAALRYQINQDPAERLPTFNGDCVSLCSLSPARTQLDGDVWRLVANVVASWRYTQADGQVVDAPAAPTGSDAHALLPVEIRWTGWWVVGAPPHDALPDAPPCQIAYNMLGRLSASATALNALATGSWGAYVAPPAAAGCLIVIGRAINPSGRPIGETIQTLYRFGVMLAANSGAQAVFGQLAPVTPSEQTLANHLAPPGAR